MGGQLTDATHDATYSGFKSRGNLTWHVTQDAMVYYTFSQGFRPGAGNRKNSAEATIRNDADDVVPQSKTPSSNLYAPDTLTNNEIGWKTEWFDHRLLVNGSAYIMDWKNVQTLIYNPVYGNTTFGVAGPDYRSRAPSCRSSRASPTA